MKQQQQIMITMEKINQIFLKNLKWKPFLSSLITYLSCLSIVSKFSTQQLDSLYVYTPGTAYDHLKSNHGFLNFLVYLLRFPLILSYTTTMTMIVGVGLLTTSGKKVGVTATTTNSGLPQLSHLLYLIPLAGGLFAIVENTFLFLSVMISANVVFLCLASFTGLFKSLLLGTATWALVVATTPMLLKNFFSGVGRDGRQRIQNISF